jgi:TMEM175 potassium channel family protein
MFAKARLDTLSDSIFAVAMTLLALDVRLPDNFEPHDSGELIAALINLWPKLLPYVVSFGVLGLRWLSNIQVRSHAEHVNREYVKWWLLYLLLITCVPFSTMVVGRYARLAPSIWLYAGHTLLIALIGFRLVRITPHLEHGDHLRERQISALLLVVASLLAIAVSFVSPHVALFAFCLTFAGPWLSRWSERHVAAN